MVWRRSLSTVVLVTITHFKSRSAVPVPVTSTDLLDFPRRCLTLFMFSLTKFPVKMGISIQHVKNFDLMLNVMSVQYGGCYTHGTSWQTGRNLICKKLSKTYRSPVALHCTNLELPGRLNEVYTRELYVVILLRNYTMWRIILEYVFIVLMMLTQFQRTSILSAVLARASQR